MPRVLFFHATNAKDKEIALKANGYWLPEASAAARPSSVEARLQTARPKIVAFAPAVAEGASDALATADVPTHFARW